MFHRHVEALALVAPLDWDNPISWRSRGCVVVAGKTDAAIPFWVHLRRLVGPDPLELVERCFPDIDGIGCHSNSLVGFEPLQHREEVDVGVGQHRGPEMGELRLRAIVVGEDVTKLALGWHSDQRAREAGVPDKVVELSAVGHQPPCEPFSICLAALGEFADDRAAPVPVFWQPNLGLLLEGDDRLADFERQEQARLYQEGKELCRGPATFGEMPSKPGRDDRMAGSLKLPFYNFGEACAYVFGKRTVDSHAGHAVSRMPKPLEIGLGFAHALEGCRIAGLHVDRSDFPRIVDHRVTEAAVAVLHAGLDVWEELGRGWLPAVPFLCQDASRVVFTEGSVSELGVAQFGADRSESFVDLSCPEGVAVLDWSMESSRSWPPRSQTAIGPPRVTSRMACQTLPS